MAIWNAHMLAVGPVRLLLLSGLIGAAALSAPAVPAGQIVVHVSPAIRNRLRNLRLVDVPREWRMRNWTGSLGQGSCVHASLVTLLHWQGRHRLADWWAGRYSNGETPEGLAARLDQAGVRFAQTRDGDERFLDWALRTRRGAAVVVQNGRHMVVLVGWDRQRATLLDCNDPGRLSTVPRRQFLDEWKSSGGWAVTPCETPPAPHPWLLKGTP